ncbi:MAG TPA: glycosyltransferase [Methylomirabilota bacterium]|nr:glycosyltransferase [Methylomirabilota bacterium]
MQSRSIAVPPPSPRGLLQDGRKLEARGKFFFSGVEKVFLKGVTYGPFAPDGFGTQFPDRETVKRDLSLMVGLGANTFRTFTVPPRWLLDLAAERDLRVLAGLPWAEHVCFLDSKPLTRSIRRTVAEAVTSCADHPALAAYLVGNEIPPDIVRWYGAPRVAGFLRELVDVVRGIDPESLVGYANFPSTEYLETDFTDFLAFNVYLHREADLRRYLYRLHTLAGDRPLVLTEFGMDSFRHGEQEQAETLSWQVRTALEMGAAGTYVFALTDEWFTGGEEVRDWGFGLVDRERRTKAAYRAVRRWYATDALPALVEYPKVSVVVCAYNAESTMAACLDSLRELRYPAYEVVVVDDGSTDRTGEIADQYEGIHVIHQENKGLSAARNVGIAASTGEIVAFTDSDCIVDPDWLHYLVATFLSSGGVAVGGPNLPPPEDSLVATCVAASPGGPLHVLLNDEEAEHIPGCNMAFRREVLEELGGFDPIYRAAGDDVDLCWRLQERGYRIAFSPAAMVWHFRRNTVKAYIGQQRGYGKAEGLLYFRHPQRFNALGYSRWRGRIYGGIYSLFTSLFSLRRPVIYGGVFGRGLFQTLYHPPSSFYSYLPFTLEWSVAAAALLAYAFVRGGWAWFGAVPLLLTWGCCLGAALRARVDPRADNLRGRLLIALLTYVGPLLRCFERYRWLARGISAAKPVEEDRPARSLPVSWRERAFAVSYWTENGLEKETLLHGLREAVTARQYFVLVDQGWSEWDLQVYGGFWSRARVKVATEYHCAGRRVMRVKCALRTSLLTRLVGAGALLLGTLAVTLGSPLAAAAALGVAAVGGLAFAREGLNLGRTLHRSLQAVARRARLHYAPPLQARAPETK